MITTKSQGTVEDGDKRHKHARRLLFAVGDPEISPTAKPRLKACIIYSVAVGDAPVAASLRDAEK